MGGNTTSTMISAEKVMNVICSTFISNTMEADSSSYQSQDVTLMGTTIGADGEVVINQAMKVNLNFGQNADDISTLQGDIESKLKTSAEQVSQQVAADIGSDKS